MYRKLFTNYRFALGFAAATIVSALLFVGSQDHDSTLDTANATEQQETVASENDVVEQPAESQAESQSEEPVEFLSDDELVEEPTGDGESATENSDDGGSTTSDSSDDDGTDLPDE